MTKTESLADLLREARRDWITDTEWVGDQYGGATQPRGEAIRAFGARIDAALQAEPTAPRAEQWSPQFPWGVSKDMTYVPTKEFQAMKAELESLRVDENILRMLREPNSTRIIPDLRHRPVLERHTASKEGWVAEMEQDPDGEWVHISALNRSGES